MSDVTDHVPSASADTLGDAAIPDVLGEVAAGSDGMLPPREATSSPTTGDPTSLTDLLEHETASEGGESAHVVSDEVTSEPLTPLSPSEIAALVHAGFARARKWTNVPLAAVEKVVSSLDLSLETRSHATPRLRLHRLRFEGEKTLLNGAKRPIVYDQTFAPGVNVLLVQSNSVGKSSVLNTIKFALTGDDGGYEHDVKPWIERVWLQFVIGGVPHTIHLARESRGLSGYIVGGHVTASLTEVDAADVAIIARMPGGSAVSEALQHFFLDRFRLHQLGWTHTERGVTSDRFISWLTFFQAMVIPSNSEQYLLVDEEHAIGNQEGLLLSTLLGLQLARPINALLLESRKTQSEAKISKEERAEAEAALMALLDERRRLEDELRSISEAQTARRGALGANPDVQRLQSLYEQQGQQVVERIRLQQRRSELNTQSQRLRSRARSLRETADLQMHFTGLTVAVCPNCDLDVDAAAVERERHDHRCRLCGKDAQGASTEDVAVLHAQADAFDAEAVAVAVQREALVAEVRKIDAVLPTLAAEIAQVEAVRTQGAEYALPTAAEQDRRDAILQQLGELRVRVGLAEARLSQVGTSDTAGELRAEIQQRVRNTLYNEAQRLNGSVLAQLNRLTREMVTRIGVVSVSDLTCSPVGKLTLIKNDVPVGFNALRSPGERLRIKLSFFTAMMRLGRLRGAGKHPGFLLIDQPGSDEIVDEDFVALAQVLRELDTKFADEIQIICFTARPQFSVATRPEKIYGPQAAPSEPGEKPYVF